MTPTPVPVPVPVPLEADGQKKVEHRSAILFVSGLTESGPDQTAEGVASRLAHALNWNAREGKAKFTVLPGSNEINISDQLTLGQATVERTSADGTKTALDVWRLPTSQELTEDYDASTLMTKVARGARVVVRYARYASFAFRAGKPAKKRIERAQLWLVRAGIVLLGLYLIGLVVALLGEVAGQSWVPDGISGAVLALTGLGIWQSKLVKRLSRAAVQLHCLLDYIGEGDSVDVFRAHFAQTLEHFAESEEIVYDRVDVLAYSFGSIVALDSIFPRPNKPGVRFENLGTLATIGCPFDLVRTYFPNYFRERHQLAGVPEAWLNVYSPRDLFGSNFEGTDGQALGIELGGAAGTARPENIPWVVVAEAGKDITVVQLLGFPGVKAHGTYWDSEREGTESVYSELVRRIYEDHALLA